MKSSHLRHPFRCKAFTLIEVLAIIAIIGTLILLAVPSLSRALYKAKLNQAISDIAKMGSKVSDFLVDNHRLPETLEEIGFSNISDPWGNLYEYFPILGKDKNEIKGKWRKDRFLVPLNADFDLYSMGKDGKSVAPLRARASYDDIIRANNGSYIGLGSKY